MKYGYNDDLPKIPSEILEPWLRNFLMMKLECLHHGLIDIETLRSDLRGVESFIGLCGGVHSSIITSNIYNGVCMRNDEEILSLVHKIFNEK